MKASVRATVTGSRGKSSVVRMLHRALCACGFNCASRVTGVVPRELLADKEIPLLRSGAANVREIQWWIKQLPDDADAIVTENSAVAPEYQNLASRWLDSKLTVFTNIKPDHSASWGTDENSIIEALAGGLPFDGTVILPAYLSEHPAIKSLAKKKRLMLVPADVDRDGDYIAINKALALKLCEHIGLDTEKCSVAIDALKPDIADSVILKIGKGELAFAFSINDTESTEQWFRLLGWPRSDCTVIYNHRSDRNDRLASFAPWLLSENGRLIIIGDCPSDSQLKKYYRKIAEVDALADMIAEGGKYFGCGNTVYGLPLKLKLKIEKERTCSITHR